MKKSFKNIYFKINLIILNKIYKMHGFFKRTKKKNKRKIKAKEITAKRI